MVEITLIQRKDTKEIGPSYDTMWEKHTIPCESHYITICSISDDLSEEIVSQLFGRSIEAATRILKRKIVELEDSPYSYDSYVSKQLVEHYTLLSTLQIHEKYENTFIWNDEAQSEFHHINPYSDDGFIWIQGEEAIEYEPFQDDGLDLEEYKRYVLEQQEIEFINTHKWRQTRLISSLTTDTEEKNLELIDELGYLCFPDHQDKFGKTALQKASLQNYYNVVVKMCDMFGEQCLPSVASNSGHTALMSACILKKGEPVVNKLLETFAHKCVPGYIQNYHRDSMPKETTAFHYAYPWYCKGYYKESTIKKMAHCLNMDEQRFLEFAKHPSHNTEETDVNGLNCEQWLLKYREKKFGNENDPMDIVVDDADEMDVEMDIDDDTDTDGSDSDGSDSEDECEQIIEQPIKQQPVEQPVEQPKITLYYNGEPVSTLQDATKLFTETCKECADGSSERSSNELDFLMAYIKFLTNMEK